MRVLLSIVGVFAIVTLFGCGGGGGGGGDQTPTTISNAVAITPSGFSFLGGSVTIQAVVTDSSGVNRVVAIVTGPNDAGSPTEVRMLVVSGDKYSGRYDAPPNLRTDGQPDTYSVKVRATDKASNTRDSASFTFRVPAPDMPQPPF